MHQYVKCKIKSSNSRTKKSSNSRTKNPQTPEFKLEIAAIIGVGRRKDGILLVPIGSLKD